MHYSLQIVNLIIILMHVISKKPFVDASNKYPKYAKAIMQAYDILRKVECKTPEELKQYFSSLDNFKYKDKWYVIDISGNNIRLMAFIEFRAGKILLNMLSITLITTSYVKNMQEVSYELTAN
jgi:mRNA interferase HigB